MLSRTKYSLTDPKVQELFVKNGIGHVTNVAPLGAGEYNAVFCATAQDGKEYALKVAPSSKTPVLTYEKGMMASEVFWYEQIRTRTGIRVPEVHAADFSKTELPTDYFIMEKLSGTQLDKTEFSEAEKAESSAVLAKMAAEIHKIKNDRFGYVQSGLYDNWYLAFSAMIEAVLHDCAKKHRRSPRGKKLLSLVKKHQSVFEKAECCMVNFDLWAPNVLCTRENGALRFSWLDPERSFWGDRICDFVCLETMAALGDKRASLEAYNSVSDKPVLATKDEQLRYAGALAYLALIMEVEKYYRYSPFHFGWWRNVGASSRFYKMAFSMFEHAER